MSMNDLKFAAETVKAGEVVLVHDFSNRENETDMVLAAEYATPEKIRQLRMDAGGLLCVALSHDLCKALQIPYMADVLARVANEYPPLQKMINVTPAYGDRSSFSITINHKKTFTGVTDHDRAKTISELGKLCRTYKYNPRIAEEFGEEFSSPGHVTLLAASKNLLAERRGHTELSVYLAQIADVTPAMVICEMLDPESYGALSVDRVRRYASQRAIPFLEGSELAAHYREQSTIQLSH